MGAEAGTAVNIVKELGLAGLYRVCNPTVTFLRFAILKISAVLLMGLVFNTELYLPHLQGWTACALRDIPFSAIYYTSYFRSKKFLREARTKREGKPAGDTLIDSLIAGLVAVR